MFGVNMGLSKTMEKLSSGFRINRAGDDAAGLAISEKLKAQVSGLNQASRNSLDGISMIQTAEAGMDELQSMLHRIRDLAVQASNDSLGDTERNAIKDEINQLDSELQQIATRTKFNGQSLLDGSLTTSASGGTLAAGNILNTTGGSATVENIDVSGAQAGSTYTFSASGTSVTLTESGTGKSHTVTSAGVGANSDATLDFSSLGVKVTFSSNAGAKTAAGLATDLAALTITTAAGSGSANFHTGAYSGETTNVSFVDVRVDNAAGMSTFKTAIDAFETGTPTQAEAETLISGVDSALDFISSQRATLGAVQNRLEHTIANVKNAAENLSASNSRIRDVDVAEESSALAKFQILSQAGVAMLAQANQMPQLALKLLG
jgi:flagellin